MSIEISILLPTRRRTDWLRRSLMSLVDNATDPKRLEFRLAFDDDDTETAEWFLKNVAPDLDRAGCIYTVMQFPRLGYTRLNEYVNALAKDAQGRWLFFYGDDGIVHTKGWDDQICAVKEFRVLRIPTHNCHPYAIWPIVPRDWYELFGYVSAHGLSDTWCSQIGYILDIMKNLDIEATHDRPDLTGEAPDETAQQKVMLEGNIHDPRDFNHVNWRNHRMSDCNKIYEYLKKQGDPVVTWYEDVREGKQDPFEKMMNEENDPNKQIARIA